MWAAGAGTNAPFKARSRLSGTGGKVAASAPGNPWHPQTRQRERRAVPSAWQAFLSSPDTVEELADALRSLGIAGYVDFPLGCEATPDFGIRCGSVLTARYVPKKAPSDENRLGHDIIGKAIVAGDIVVVDEQNCTGSVIGGIAAGKLKKAVAGAVVVNGFGRDLDEVHGHGLPAIAMHWGIGGAKNVTELAAIGEGINFRGIAVESTDVAVVNRFGMAIIPAFVSWEELGRAMGRGAPVGGTAE